MKLVLQAILETISFVGLLFLSLTTADAQAVAGANRPAGVPAGYLVTPFGYFHPSCVVRLAEGDVLRPDDKLVRHTNGSSSAMPVCAFAHYRADGERVFGDERAVTNPNISHAYVEYATVTSTASYGYMYAKWTVPPAPASNNDQTLYLFAGLEDIDDVVTIIQPVLGWNSDYASDWGIASWNCCVAGTTYEATPHRVSSGDTILGYMYNSCPPGTESCGSWDIVTLDLRNGGMSQLLNTSNFGQTFNWAFGAAFEVYGIRKCSDYPAVNGNAGSHSIAFDEEGLFDGKLKQINNPPWTINVTSGLTPACNYGGSLPKEIILNY